MTLLVRVQAGYAEGLEVRVGALLKRPERIRGFALFCVGYLAAMMALAVGLYLSDSGSGGDAVVALAFVAVFGLPALLAIWRIASAGLQIGEDEILVRRPIRTRRVSPLSVLGFEPGIFGFVGNGTPGPVLRLSNGESIGIWALGREGLVWSFDRYLREVEPLCDELNAALRQVTEPSARRELVTLS